MDESNQNQVASNEANTPPTLQTFSSNKIAAGICGILIGSLGIHKFILGLTTPGIIMVLVTVLTCGVGGLVMSIIGFIEGVIYLSKTDEDFYQTYAIEKKPWF
jgi:TM2 domain-containing membrane protein YozV